MSESQFRGQKAMCHTSQERFGRSSWRWSRQLRHWRCELFLSVRGGQVSFHWIINCVISRIHSKFSDQRTSLQESPKMVAGIHFLKTKLWWTKNGILVFWTWPPNFLVLFPWSSEKISVVTLQPHRLSVERFTDHWGAGSSGLHPTHFEQQTAVPWGSLQQPPVERGTRSGPVSLPSPCFCSCCWFHVRMGLCTPCVMTRVNVISDIALVTMISSELGSGDTRCLTAVSLGLFSPPKRPLWIGVASWVCLVYRTFSCCLWKCFCRSPK